MARDTEIGLPVAARTIATISSFRSGWPALLAILICSATMFGDSFTFSSFSPASNINLVGSAAIAGSVLRLTPATQFQAGAAWYATQVPVANGFQTTFDFELTNASTPPGDGFAFVVQNSGVFALGLDGGNLGYGSPPGGGIPDSIAVEADVYKNGPPIEYGDVSGNEIAVQSCGTGPNSANHLVGCTLGITNVVSPTMADGAAHQVVISYVPDMLTISLDGSNVLQAPVNLSTELSLSGGDHAWIGFTGSTGGAYENNDILSWNFNSASTATPEPASLVLFGSGLLGLAGVVRRKAKRSNAH